MNQAERFVYKEPAAEPGPGAYNEDIVELRRGHSAVFNSGTVRDVFDSKQ